MFTLKGNAKLRSDQMIKSAYEYWNTTHLGPSLSLRTGHLSLLK